MLRARFRRAPLLLGVVMCMTSTAVAMAQSVLLQIRPRVGDTLHLRLDQQTELTSTRALGGAGPVTTVTTTMRVYSRAIIERSAPSATYVRAVTDSVRLTSTDERALNLDDARRALEGRAMTLWISPDGTVSLADTTDDGAHEGADAVSLMPAALPRGPVEVGYTWSRDMPLPAGGRIGGGASNGWLHTRFRLDSLSQKGTFAYVSMRGEMNPERNPGASNGAGPELEHGSVSGTMRFDRARGWLTESQFTIIAHSIVHVPGSDNTVMRFETRVTQHMRTVERR